MLRPFAMQGCAVQHTPAVLASTGPDRPCDLRLSGVGSLSLAKTCSQIGVARERRVLDGRLAHGCFARRS